MKKLVLLAGGALGGTALAAMISLGIGAGSAGADVVVPIPEVGAVGLVSSQISSNVAECAIVELQADQAGPLGACLVDISDPGVGGTAGFSVEILDGGNPLVIPLAPKL